MPEGRTGNVFQCKSNHLFISTLLYKQLNVDYYTKYCYPALYVQFFWDVIITEFMWNDPTLNLLHQSPLDIRGVKPGWPQSKQHLAS